MLKASCVFEVLLADPPKLHQHPSGMTIAGWCIDRTTTIELGKRLNACLRIVGTGAGFDRILVASQGFLYTCTVADEDLINRIKTYFQRYSISLDRVDFVLAGSVDVVSQLSPGLGSPLPDRRFQEFPTALVDFLFAIRNYARRR